MESLLLCFFYWLYLWETQYNIQWEMSHANQHVSSAALIAWVFSHLQKYIHFFQSHCQIKFPVWRQISFVAQTSKG